MLQRFLGRSSRHIQPVTLSGRSAVCECNCDRRSRAYGPSDQRRDVNRAAPAVWRKERARDREVARDGANEKKQRMERLARLDAAALESSLRQMKLRRDLHSDVDDVVDFLNKFSTLASQSQAGRVGVPVVGEQKLSKLCEEYDVSDNDLVAISVWVLLRLESPDYRLLGKRLLYSASNAGSEQATIRIMNHALLSNKDRPATLHSTELVHARDHLREISKRGKNYRAMVLDGKIFYEMGNHDHAITLWRQAMDAAVAASEEAKRMAAAGVRPPQDTMPGADLTDLSSPWVELQSVYLTRSDYANAKWAIAIGCEQDDPSSHYAAALFEKKFTEDGEEVGTSGWLYHMTKAAASGHVKAMHELGVWYARNGWPYLDDEPPEHVKPTPFDRYPHDSQVRQSTDTTLWQKARAALGRDPPVEEDPKYSVFHTAAYPTTPQQRYQMALQWLEIAMGFTYAPSYLIAAQIHLHETIWPGLATPKVALEMKNERYVYASKIQYEADRPYQSPSTDERSSNNLKNDVPNPNYNPAKAKQLVREIFYAASALEVRQYHLKNFMSHLRRGTAPRDIDTDVISHEEVLPTDLGPNLKKYFRYPDIREQYMNDRTGQLYDEVLGKDLLEEAQIICEEQKWDIYAEDGGLLYRHGLSKERTTPLAASGAR